MKIFYPQTLKGKPAKVKYLAHTINHRSNILNCNGEYVSLHSDILKLTLGMDYRTAVIKPCLDQGIIESDYSYQADNKALGYRLTEQYRKDTFVWRTIDDGVIERRVKAAQVKHNHALKKRVNGTPYKQCVADAKCITVDAIDWASLEVPKKLNKGGVLIERETRIDKAKWAVDNIRRRNWYITVCDYGRLHTNVTCLPNFVMDSLRLKGKPVVSVDVKNSQPVFLTLWLKNYLHTYTHRANPDSILLCSLAETLDTPIFKELNALQKCVKNGLFYDFIADDQKITRDEAKLSFFEYAYGRNKPSGWPNATQQHFIKRYPSLHQILFTFKREAYQRLAREMQKAESDFIFNSVVPLIREHTNSPILTKHDSVLCWVDDQQTVIDSFGEAASNKYISLSLHT